MTKKLLTFLTVAATIINVFGLRPVLAANPPILITELQTGFIDNNGVEFPRQEFIELTNVSSSAVNLTGWRLEYLSAANDGSTPASLTIDTLNGQISINGHGMWEHEGYYPISPDSIFGVGDTSSSGYLAKSGGHVRLINGTTMIDCVSWGTAVAIAGCDKVSATAGAGYTIQRRLTNGTYDKSTGVANLTPATPQGNNIYSLTAVLPPVTPVINPVQPTPLPSCENIQLSEVLANPAGDDNQGEFIELYNPLDHDQSLYGCSLRLSNGKEYAFSAVDSINSHQYMAFPYSATGLQLSNSGTTVTLLAVSQQTSTSYPAVGDDESWAFVAGTWYITKQPTPNLPNLLSIQPVITTVPSTIVLVAELAVCPLGKYRNLITGRCRNIVEASSAVATCVVGQERNPTTGRCRKISGTTVKTACPAGQERNSATDRCRKVAAATTQKACPAGQEFNSQTNRCRKLTATAKVLGVNTKSPRGYHYALVAVVLTAALAYGIYEYRHGISRLFSYLKRRRSVS
jgi:hypothetical protein